MGVVANPALIHSNKYLDYFYTTLGFVDSNEFLFLIGVTVLIVLSLSNAFTALVNWALLRFTAMRWHSISYRLLTKYIRQNYTFFLRRNTSELTKNIFEEVTRVVIGVLMPGADVLAQFVVTLSIVIFLFAIDPFLALLVVTVLGSAYGAIYYFTHRHLANIGRATVEANRLRFKTAAELLGGYKEIKLYGTEQHFLSRYATPSRSAARYRARQQIISRLPKYIVETAAFGGILLIVLYLLRTEDDLGSTIPLISLYAFAGYRLLPALQNIFRSSTTIRYNLSSLDVLIDELTNTSETEPSLEQKDAAPLTYNRRIKLSNISFRYPASNTTVLENINIEIKENEAIGFVGSTGCGKSTAIDLILGVLSSTSGDLIVDDTRITIHNVRSWQRNIGYVPQSIYLIDDTVLNNIALAAGSQDIDMARVERAARIACIHDFIVSQLPQGYETVIGEHGSRLSGGQRQRIGIARALYLDPPVLVFDEATSALDSDTENMIMQGLYGLNGKKTIIMVAHRITTLRQCDCIFVFREGRIVKHGSYQDLMRESADFRLLANES